MPLTVLETSAANAFETFLRLEENYSSKELTIEYCLQNHHPESQYSAVQIFSHGFLYLLSNTPCYACEMIDDLALEKRDSLTMTAASILAMKYKIAARQCQDYIKNKSVHDFSNIDRINRKSAFISNATATVGRMSVSSYEYLENWGMKVDQFKDARTGKFIDIERKLILQPIQQDMTKLLSPLLK